jgi:L-threonylcarbamoyladenylate synthase
MAIFSEDIKQAVEVLRKGGVIIYPTDTIWGIGCDATNSEAVRRIFEIKHRADSKALITLVGSIAALERTVDEVPDIAYQLIEVADKPLTIIYDHGRNVAPELLAEDGSIGIRVTTEEFSAALCKAFGKPLVSTSANISGQPSPTNFSEIVDGVLSAADYVCTSRRDETAHNTPSSIIKISAGGLFKIIR